MNDGEKSAWVQACEAAVVHGARISSDDTTIDDAWNELEIPKEEGEQAFFDIWGQALTQVANGGGLRDAFFNTAFTALHLGMKYEAIRSARVPDTLPEDPS